MAPFANYKDFDDCVRKNRDKSDPQAYCARIQAQVELTEGVEGPPEAIHVDPLAFEDGMSKRDATIRKRAQRGVTAAKCQKCGSTSKLERHHTDRRTAGIMVLCSSCHHKIAGSEEKMGQFDEGGYPTAKLEKVDNRVSYKIGTGTEVCKSCRFFAYPEGCRLVEGTIKADYVCKLWDERTVMFSELELVEEMLGGGDDPDAVDDLYPFSEGRPVRDFLTKLKDLLKGGMDFKTAVKQARAHAGGKATAAKAKANVDGKVDKEDGKLPKAAREPAPTPHTPATTNDKFPVYGTGTSAAVFHDVLSFHGDREPPDTRIFLELGTDPEWIPYLPKPGSYKHVKYGTIDITSERNARLVTNMNDGVYQSRIPLDAEHETKLSGAMAWMTAMRQNEDGSADAHVEWTDRGRKMLEGGRFNYISPQWYTSWEDPATEKTHEDVIIGGALTTRPFFKEGALRALVACESGIFSTEGPFFFKEDMMSDNKKPDVKPDVKPDPVDATEPAAGVQKLQTTVDDQAEQIKVQAKEIADMKSEARKQRFGEVVAGHKPDLGGELQWFGEPEKHVSLMEKIADAFGDDSDELKQYCEQNKAHAAQIADSGIFNADGSDQGGGPKGKGSSATAEFDAAVEKKMSDNKDIDKSKATEMVATEDPDLIDRVNAETTVRV